MSKKSIQKMSEKEIQQKIKRIENNNKLIEAKIEKLKNQLKLESNSTTIPQKIKILEQHKQCIEAKTKKLQNRLKELESKVLKSTSKTKEKAKNQAKKIETQEYFTDASKRNGKTKIAIYSPTKDIKKSKEIANCNTNEAEFLAILWALSHANTKKEHAIIYNDNTASITKAKKEFKEHKNIKFLWISRKKNKIADKLARG